MDKNRKKTFCFDIDGVIVTLTPDNDYARAKPILSTIELVNALYDSGHTIILFTARGYITKKNWIEQTKQQMQDLGVQYHQLIFGKPAADYYIDDRMITLEQARTFI